MTRTLIAILLAATPAAAQQVPPTAPSPYVRAIAAGYKAAMYCSGIFVAGRTEAQIDRDEMRGIYPDYDPIAPSLSATVNRHARRVSVAFDDTLPPRYAIWNRGKGCTTLPISSVPPPIADGSSYAPAPADPSPWPLGDAGIAPKPSKPLAAAVAAAFDHASYGKDSETVGVVVMKDGCIVAERYRDGFGPFVANRTWSVAKSITGMVIGAAQNGGRIDVARAANIPEWRVSSSYLDPRNGITVDQMLRMSSGLHSDTAGNRTDAIYFGGSAVTEEATGRPIDAKPGTRFRYANNDILLAVRALRASLADDVAYRAAPAAFFDRLGMKHSVAESDWRGNFVLSSQVWSTARDLARFGLFMAQDGVWQGQRILPAGWIADSIRPSGPQPEGDGPGYGRTLWLFGAKQGLPAGSYAAQGARGQYVMVIPSQRLVIVRRGEDPGPARFDIARFAADIAKAAR